MAGRISNRLVLAGAALITVVVLAILGLVYAWTTQAVQEETRAALEAEIHELRERHREAGQGGLQLELERRMAIAQRGGRFYLLVHEKWGKVTGNLEQWPNEVRGSERGSFASPEGMVQAETIELPDGSHLLVGRDTDAQRSLARRIGFLLAGCGTLVALLSIAAGLSVGGRLLRRVNEMSGVIGEILSGRSTKRVPAKQPGDEFDRLARQFNGLLDRNDQLLAQLRGVAHDVAHELKTPLTRMRTRIEAARADAPLADEGVLETSLGEIDDLLKTFEALLRIARVETGDARQGFTEVELSDVVSDAVELYEPLVEDEGRSLVIDRRIEARVRGDRALLTQCLANLIDNAVRYAPPGSSIEVGLKPAGRGRVTLSVADHGPGVPAEDRERVLDRFVRLDYGRASGAGLGLSLVRAVAELHGASLALEDNAPGLRVGLTFAPVG